MRSGVDTVTVYIGLDVLGVDAATLYIDSDALGVGCGCGHHLHRVGCE